MIAALIVVASLAMFRVATDDPQSSHNAGLLTGLKLVGYALGEEYAWRGYLQQALGPIPVAVRVGCTAVLWYLWHLNVLNPSILLSAHIVHCAGLLLGSWGLLKVSEVTGSLLFVAAVHLSFNLAFDVDASSSAKLSTLGFSAAVCIVPMARLTKSRKRASAGEAPAG